MNFIKYNDIENATNKEIYHFKESSLYVPEDKWYVTEKVHGCLDECTLIDTEDGKKSIKEICDNFPVPYKIKTFNVDTGIIEYVECSNISIQENIGNWFILELEDGTTLVITGNHKIFLPELNCYRSVEHLIIGDEVLINRESSLK